MKKIFALFACLFVQLHGLQDLPHPYNELEELRPFNDHGFYINGPELEKIIGEKKVKTIIELGSWIGASTRHMASILPEDGMVYAVDHWEGSEDLHAILSPDCCPDLYYMLPVLYEQFLSNVIHTGLTHKITPMKMTTLEAAEEFKRNGIQPDLVYVDASHDEESVYADLVAYYPLVKGHGILCGDDWGWGEGFPVMNAVKRFAKENNLHIETPNNWLWVLYEKTSTHRIAKKHRKRRKH